MREIKDYLHLYPTCKVFVRDAGGVAYEDTIDAIVIDESVNLKEYGDFYFDSPDGAMIQLCLRPLSDLTEEEKAEWDNISLVPRGYARRTVCTEAETTAYLLSKHFDLFGLIEDGLAIDKTKVPA